MTYLPQPDRHNQGNPIGSYRRNDGVILGLGVERFLVDVHVHYAPAWNVIRDTHFLAQLPGDLDLYEAMDKVDTALPWTEWPSPPESSSPEVPSP